MWYFTRRGHQPLTQPQTWRTRSPYQWPPETGWALSVLRIIASPWGENFEILASGTSAAEIPVKRTELDACTVQPLSDEPYHKGLQTLTYPPTHPLTWHCLLEVTRVNEWDRPVTYPRIYASRKSMVREFSQVYCWDIFTVTNHIMNSYHPISIANKLENARVA